MQNETETVVNIKESFESKNFYRYTVQVYHFFQKLVFNSYLVRYVNQYTDWVLFDDIPVTMG